MDQVVEERLQKQTFLRQEILEKGYDAQEFKIFMDSQRQNGSSIDVWNTFDLQQIVTVFKNNQNQKKKFSDKLIEDLLNDDWGDLQKNQGKDPVQLQDQQQIKTDTEVKRNSLKNKEISPKNIKEKQQQENTQIQKSSQENVQKEKDENLVKGAKIVQKHIIVKDLSEFSSQSEQKYDQKVNCSKLTASLFNPKQEVIVNINQFQVIQGGYFTSSYIEYNIVTNPFGWQVKRRFSDFVWLRNTILRLFPQIIVPPLPLKKMKTFEDQEALQRALFLEKFLNNCLNQQLIRNSRAMHEFLYITDDKVFKIRVKECDKIAKPQLLSEYYDLEGQIQLQISDELEAYCQASDEYSNQSEQNYKKVKKLYKQLRQSEITNKIVSQQMGVVSKTMSKIGETFLLMNRSTELFNRNVEIGQNPYLQEQYLMGSLMMSDWGETFARQARMLEQDMHQYIKYNEKEMNGIRELIKLRNSNKFEYLRLKKQVTIKKRQLIENNDFKNMELRQSDLDKYKIEYLQQNKNLLFDLILPNDTKQLMDVKDIFAYYNYQVYKEVSQFFVQKSKVYCDHYINFTKQQSQEVSQVHLIWAEKFSHFTDLLNIMQKNQ